MENRMLRTTNTMPYVASVLLFIALVGLRIHDQRDLAAVEELADSAISGLRHEIITRDQLLGPGDSLPDVILQDSYGMPFALRSLPAQGYPYLYFYKDPCPPCEILKSLLDESQSPIKDSMAFIAFRQLATGSKQHFSWTENTESAAIRGVPTLLHATATGRVMSSAHYSIFKAAQYMDLLGLVDKREVDAIVTALQNGG